MKKIKKTSNKANSNRTNKISKKYTNLKFLLLVLNLAVVFYSPFVRGLYFEAEQLPVEIFVFANFLVFWVIKYLSNDRKLICTPMEYFSISLVMIYFLSILTAVSLRLAISEWLKYCMYFSLFFMITDLIVTIKEKFFALWVLVIASLGLCIIGIDSASGSKLVDAVNWIFAYFHIPVKFFGLYVDNRINSTLQYPNALASYLMAVFFIAITLSIVSSKKWVRLLVGACSYIFMLTIILSVSRGVLLLMPVFVILYLFIIPKQYRIKSFLLIIIVALFSSASAVLSFVKNDFSSGVIGAITSNLWLITLLGLFISVAIMYLLGFSKVWINKFKFKVKPYFAIIPFAVLFVILIVVLSFPGKLVLVNSGSELEAVNTYIKSISLKPGENYKFTFDASEIDKIAENSLQVRVESRSKGDILLYRNRGLAYTTVRNIEDIERVEIPFSVPKDSLIVDLRFINTSKDTKIFVENAQIIKDADAEIKNVKFGYKYIPDFISKRFSNFFVSPSSIQRQIYIADGLKMFKDHWFLGAGGGAWSVISFSYQSYLYWSSQAHAYMVQVAIESGILGLLVLIMLIISIVIQFSTERKYKKEFDDKNKMLQSTLFISILAMYTHSVLDFDLSLSAVYILLWTMMALFNSSYRHERFIADKKDNNSKKGYGITNRLGNFKTIHINPFLAIMVSFIIMVMPILLGLASYYNSKFNIALSEGNTQEAIENIKKASSLDSFNPEYKVKYADLLISKKNISKDESDVAKKLIEDAQKLGRHSVSISESAASLYIKMSELDKGLAAIDKSVELRPFFEQEWYAKVNLYYQVILAYLNSSRDPSEAKDYLNKALNVITEATQKNESNMIPFVFSAKTQELLEKLTYIKNDFDNIDPSKINKIKFYNIGTMDIDSNNIPDQWKITDPDKIVLNFSNGYVQASLISAEKTGWIQTRPISFESGKIYKIKLELENADKIEKLMYRIQNYHNQEYAELEKTSEGIFTAEFELPSDFNQEDSHLRLLVDKGFIIKSLIIIEE